MPKEIEKLINGNKLFREKFFNKDKSLFDDLIQGQKPKIMLISCSDSRVDPAIIFNCEPGELFVVRNVANLVPPCEADDTFHGISAALEFGTCFLEVRNIIIFGHTQCGGIQSLFNKSQILNKAYSFISKWMQLAKPAYDKVMQQKDLSLEEKVTLCEKYSLINSLKNLKTFPWIKERVDKNKLFLHTWCFNLSTGKIEIYDQQNNKWN
ncbi:hypothetical protein A3F66_06255 [candidate division TM6 bacterium RIFCSPHIGHO2_12_FULL_32_22]|nr:MAG: hypothetical protein A3F66_06255 [candidate division TM6 bacterium RIFCSPHIGHO2_12_FULL_32_22]